MTGRRPFLADWRNAIRDDQALDSIAKLAAYTLSTYFTKDGKTGHTDLYGKFHPSPAGLRIAKEMGYADKRTAVSAIRRLAAGGYLKIGKSKGRVPHKYEATLPTVHLDAPLEPEEKSNRASESPQPCVPVHPTVHPHAPECVVESDEGDQSIEDRAQKVIKNKPALASWLRNVGALLGSERDFARQLAETWHVYDRALADALFTIAQETP